MKGLIRNNFYSMGGNLKISFLLSSLLVFTPFLFKVPSILYMSISAQIFIFIANVGASLQADETAKWNRYERTLPVKEAAIVGAKYITFCILILMGLGMSAVTGLVIYFTGMSMDFNAILWGYEYGLTLSVIVASLTYPAILKMGAEKSELIILLSAAVSIFILAFIAFMLSPFTGEMSIQSSFVGAISVIISPLFLLISYMVSLHIYSKKEF